jgi:hypothetical protein
VFEATKFFGSARHRMRNCLCKVTPKFVGQQTEINKYSRRKLVEVEME